MANSGHSDAAALTLEAYADARRCFGLRLFILGRIRRRADRRAPRRRDLRAEAAPQAELATAAGVAAGLAVIIFLIV